MLRIQKQSNRSVQRAQQHIFLVIVSDSLTLGFHRNPSGEKRQKLLAWSVSELQLFLVINNGIVVAIKLQFIRGRKINSY